MDIKLDATSVNRMHAQNIKRLSDERHVRAKIQTKSELIDNRNINYRKHMKWMNK